MVNDDLVARAQPLVLQDRGEKRRGELEPQPGENGEQDRRVGPIVLRIGEAREENLLVPSAERSKTA